ncbi:MAG: hypothetical protein KDA79_12425 [Planctomycetaceae bacterium]|nr:hypothetical protein [Planctomycetaceae bacterium]
MLLRGYLIFSSVLLGGYALTALSGREFGPARIRKVPPPIRQPYGGRTSSSGYRFGGGGYRGGK